MDEPNLRRRPGRGTRRPLPRRVRLAIMHQQYQSERLIGWIQLLIIAALAALFVLAGGDGAGRPWLHPAVAVLGALALVTATRLVLAHRRWLPRSILIASEAIDILLLMSLIWSLHLHYDQPASFSLKTPTWAYVFIFIALRALRLEPRYVVVAGLAAIVGWTALVVLAMLETPASTMTDDVVAHAYGAGIMVAAEIDKLLSIALVTIILTLALTRGRRLLIEAATGSAAARDLARFFSPAIVRRITQAEQPLLPGHGETRDAAVVHVDIKGFTRLASKLSAGETLRLLTAYQARVVPIVRAHGGAVDKFLGDGIMAVFVADGDSTRHARDALEASLEIATAMAVRCPFDSPGPTPGQPLDVSIGIADGPVVIGAVGAPDRLEYTVIGHAVNLASKLERHTRAEAASIIAAGSTVDLAIAQGFVPPPEAARRLGAVAGLDGPLPIMVLASRGELPADGRDRATPAEALCRAS